MQTLPFEGHTLAYQCKGLDQSNIVCEYEVNMSTNEKVIAEICFYTNCWRIMLNIKVIWRSMSRRNILVKKSWPKSLSNDKVITEIQSFNAKW